MKSRRLSLFLTFLKIGAFTFGGGYAMIALLEHELIEKKGWIGHDEFLDMAAIAESTPGPVAVNAATYVGFHVAGVSGAALATLAVCLPSFLIIFAISQFFDRRLCLPRHSGLRCLSHRIRRMENGPEAAAPSAG